MLSDLKYEGDLDGLVNQLGNATALTPDLIRHVIADTCTRLPALKNAGKQPTSTGWSRLVLGVTPHLL